MSTDKNNVQTFTDLMAVSAKRNDPVYRRLCFEYYFSNVKHRLFEYPDGNIYILTGAVYSDTEFHIAEKLTKTRYHVVFPSQRYLGKGRKHDVFLCDSKTFILQKAELKSLFGHTAETVKRQLSSGSEQAGIIIYDIQSVIKKNWLIDGLRKGWTINLKTIILNYKGQWYQIDKKTVFADIIYKMLK